MANADTKDMTNASNQITAYCPHCAPRCPCCGRMLAGPHLTPYPWQGWYPLVPPIYPSPTTIYWGNNQGYANTVTGMIVTS